jgi:hypothetical protein
MARTVCFVVAFHGPLGRSADRVGGDEGARIDERLRRNRHFEEIWPGTLDGCTTVSTDPADTHKCKLR